MKMAASAVHLMSAWIFDKLSVMQNYTDMKTITQKNEWLADAEIRFFKQKRETLYSFVGLRPRKGDPII